MRTARILALLLLLANLAFYAWSRWMVAPAAAAPAGSAVPALRLALGGHDREATPSDPTICRRLGPFVDAAAAAGAAKTLAALQFAPSVSENSRIVPAQYFVFLDGVQSATEQRQVVARLRRAGVIDAAPVDSPAGSLRVSIGLFDDQGRAVTRSALARAAGFSPQVEVRNREIQEHWVALRVDPSAELPPPAQLGSAGARLSWGDCAAAAP